MNLNPQEQQVLNNFLIGFTQDVDHTILNILFKIVIPDTKEKDNLLIKCYERYMSVTEPFLAHMSKEKIGFGLTCRETLQRFLLSQLEDSDVIAEFRSANKITDIVS